MEHPYFFDQKGLVREVIAHTCETLDNIERPKQQQTIISLLFEKLSYLTGNSLIEAIDQQSQNRLVELFDILIDIYLEDVP
jgi:hypothetical protein